MPVTPETRLIWHEPVPPVVLHGLGVVELPGPLSLVQLIWVPSGAAWKPVPSPLLTLTWAVHTCVCPTRFVPLGVIWMFASTNVFTAFPELGAIPSVSTVNGAEPTTERVEEAWPVTLPAVGEV